MSRKGSGLLVALLLTGSVCFAEPAGPEAVTPRPAEFTLTAGTFRLPESALSPDRLPEKFPGLQLKMRDRAFCREMKQLAPFAYDAAYRIVVRPERVTVFCTSETGRFYAMQSLSQMARAGNGEIRCCSVTDYPRYAYRGLMLDLVGYWLDKDFIKAQLDMMALSKMNVLHFHAGENLAWRIQVDSYPRLHEGGAFRKGVDVVRGAVVQHCQGDAEGAYGGYYSKDDLRELVAYAARRHITILPELEMPGHNRTVLSLYPELRCVDGEGNGIESRDLCPSNEATYAFLEKILDEYMEIFPSEYICIGGDEAQMGAWKKCKNCRALMEKEGMTELPDLQAYMTARIGKYLASKGRKMIGWDEIADCGAPADAAVFAWRSAQKGERHLKAGRTTVMCPYETSYLCYAQDAPLTAGGEFGYYVPIEAMYGFEPGSSPALLGVEACDWAVGKCDTRKIVETKLYPRLFAEAEVGWTQPGRKDLGDFKRRLPLLEGILRERGYAFFDASSAFGERPEAGRDCRHKAVGAEIAFRSPYYPPLHAESVDPAVLLDGRFGGWSFADGKWVAFHHVDLVIDLKERQHISMVCPSLFKIHNVNDGAGMSGHFPGWKPGRHPLPYSMEISVSDDGTNFTSIGKVCHELENVDRLYLYQMLPLFTDSWGRYIRIVSSFDCKVDHIFPDFYLFLDEIVVM